MQKESPDLYVVSLFLTTVKTTTPEKILNRKNFINIWAFLKLKLTLAILPNFTTKFA